MPTVLVELPGGEGIVRRDDGELVLTHDVRFDRGQLLQPWDLYIPMRLGLDEQRMLFGGVLPPGAVSVEAVEATGVRKLPSVGDGAFAVIFDDGEHGEPVLGFRDAAGAFVHRPMPGEYPHESVDDAEEPCPLCGAIGYEVYFPTEDWRGGSGDKGTDSFVPSPLIVCQVCGVQHQGGGLMRFTPPSNGDEDDAERAARLARIRAEQAEQRWYENKMTLMDVPFTVYAAEGWPARINGSGSSNGNLTRLVIAHAETLTDWMPVRQPQIVVTTSIERHQPGELAIARDAFASELARSEHEQPTEGLSDAALNLWFRASHRRRAARSHEAPVSETEIMIDGAPAPFTTVGTPTAEWVAVRRHDDTTITVIGRAIDPATLSIEPVPDLEARLLGPKPDEP